jgi:hypothetical protein
MAVKTSQNMRSGVAALGYIVKSSAGQDPTAAPTLTSGSGAPTATEPNGSIYLRTDAANADQAVYSRIGGAWVALDGAP